MVEALVIGRKREGHIRTRSQRCAAIQQKVIIGCFETTDSASLRA